MLSLSAEECESFIPGFETQELLASDLEKIFYPNEVPGYLSDYLKNNFKIKTTRFSNNILKKIRIVREQGRVYLYNDRTPLDLTSLLEFNQDNIELSLEENGNILIEIPGSLKTRLQVKKNSDKNRIRLDKLGSIRIGEKKTISAGPEEISVSVLEDDDLGIISNRGSLLFHSPDSIYVIAHKNYFDITFPANLTHAQKVEFTRPNGLYEFTPAHLMKKKYVGIQSEAALSGGKLTVTDTIHGTPVAAAVGTDERVKVLITDAGINPSIMDEYLSTTEYTGTHGETLSMVLGEIDKIIDSDSTLSKIEIGHGIVKKVQDRLNKDILAANPMANQAEQLSFEEAASIGIFLTDNILSKEITKAIPNNLLGTTAALGALQGSTENLSTGIQTGRKWWKWALDSLQLKSAKGKARHQSEIEKNPGKWEGLLKDASQIAPLAADQKRFLDTLISALNKAQRFDLKIKNQKSDENLSLIHLRNSSGSKYESPAAFYTRVQDGANLHSSLKIGSDLQQATSTKFADVKFMAMPVRGDTHKFKLIRPEITVTDVSGSFVGLGEPGPNNTYLMGIVSNTIEDGKMKPKINGGDGSLVIGENVFIRPKTESERKIISIAVHHGEATIEVHKGVAKPNEPDNLIQTSLLFRVNGKLQNTSKHQLGIQNPKLTFLKRDVVQMNEQVLAGLVTVDKMDLPESAMSFEFISDPKPSKSLPLAIQTKALPLDFHFDLFDASGLIQITPDQDNIAFKLSSKKGKVLPFELKLPENSPVEIPLQQFEWSMNIQEGLHGAEFQSQLGFSTTGTDKDQPRWIKEADQLVSTRGKIPLINFTPVSLGIHRAEGRFIFSQKQNDRTTLYPTQIEGFIAGVKSDENFQDLTDVKNYQIPSSPLPKYPIWIAGYANIDTYGDADIKAGKIVFSEVPGSQNQSDETKLSGELPFAATVSESGNIEIHVGKSEVKIDSIDGKSKVLASVEKLKIPTQLKTFLKSITQGQIKATVTDIEKGVTLAADLNEYSLRDGQLSDLKGNVEIHSEAISDDKKIQIHASLKVLGLNPNGDILAHGNGEFIFIGHNSKGIPWFLHARFRNVDVEFRKNRQIHLNIPTNLEDAKKAGLTLSLGEFSSAQKALNYSEIEKLLENLNLLKDAGASELDLIRAKTLGLSKIARLHSTEGFDADLFLPETKGTQEVQVEAGSLPLEGQLGFDDSPIPFKLNFKTAGFKLDTAKKDFSWEDLKGSFSKHGDFLIQFESKPSLFNWDDLSLNTTSQLDYIWKDEAGHFKLYRFFPTGRFSLESAERIISTMKGMDPKKQQELEASKVKLLEEWKKTPFKNIALSLSNDQLLKESGEIERARENLIAQKVFFEKSLDKSKQKTHPPFELGFKILDDLEESSRLQENNYRSLQAGIFQAQNNGKVLMQGASNESITFWVRPDEFFVQAKTVMSPNPIPIENPSQEVIQSLEFQVVPNPNEMTTSKNEPLHFLEKSGLLQHRTLNAITGVTHTLYAFKNFESPLADLLWAENGFNDADRNRAQQEAQELYHRLIQGKERITDTSSLDSREARNQKESFTPLTLRLQKALTRYQKLQTTNPNLIPIPTEFLNILSKHIDRVSVFYRQQQHE